MGLFDKLKNVLFEEEEMEIPVLTKTEVPVKPQVDKTEKIKEKPQIKEEIFEEKPVKEDIKNYSIDNEITDLKNIKRDIEYDFGTDDINLKNEINDVVEEKSSPFLSFDEDEFERLNSKNHEIPKEKEKEKEKIDKEENVDLPKEKPKKFRVSPVISPVYGILDKNYKKEDIVERNEESSLVNEAKSNLNVDSVRLKAYGTLEDDIETTLNISITQEVKPKEEELVESKSIDDLISDSIDETVSVVEDDVIEEEQEEELEKPILEDEDLPSFDEIINKSSDIDYDNNNETPNDILEKTNTLKILDDIEKELNGTKEIEPDFTLEDTRETDLFNLIDSMYENKEEEEDE